MPTISGQFAENYVPGYRKFFFDKFMGLPTQYDKLFNMLTSERQYEEDRKVAGLGSMPEKPEGDPVTYDDFQRGGSTVRYTHKTFGLGYRITEEAQEDELYGIFMKINTALAKAAKQRKELLSWNVLNNAFTTFTSSGTAGTGLDGLCLCNTSHTLIGGGTASNRLATDSDLGVASLQAALTLFTNMVDERQLPEECIPKYLVIPMALRWLARQLLNSPNEPFTSENQVNSIIDDDLQYMATHYLTDADAFFVTAAPGEHDLNCYERRALQFKGDDDFDSGDAKFKATFRGSAGFSDWRGVVGTPGA